MGPARFTETLLTTQEKANVALPLERKRVRVPAPRMRWIADAIKKDALSWICTRGGWREMQVVVGGRREEGPPRPPEAY